MPTKQTLDKYGLSLPEWQSMFNAQQGLCPICLKPMKRANVDHTHAKGWKQMQPNDRKEFVRGLVCFQCNYRLLIRGMTSDRLRRAADYLDKHTPP